MISDFGLSKMEGKGDVMSTACGTPGYVGKRFAYILVKMKLNSFSGAGTWWTGDFTDICYIWTFACALSCVLFPFGIQSCNPALDLWDSLSCFQSFAENGCSQRHCFSYTRSMWKIASNVVLLKDALPNEMYCFNNGEQHLPDFSDRRQ